MAAWFIVGPLLFVAGLGLLGFLFLRKKEKPRGFRVEMEEALSGEFGAELFPPPSHRVVLSRREIRAQVEAERSKITGGKPFLF